MRARPAHAPALATAAALLAGPAGPQPVGPTLDITELRVEVTWAESEAEVRTARARLGNRAIVGPIRGRELGFSVLVRRGDEYICRIVALRPQDVDDRRTVTLGHELLHCLLGEYHP